MAIGEVSLVSETIGATDGGDQAVRALPLRDVLRITSCSPSSRSRTQPGTRPNPTPCTPPG